MKYSEISIETVTKKNRRKFDAETLAYRISEKHTEHNEMGKWDGSGSLMDVYTCDGFLIGLSPFNQRPMMVATSLQNMIDQLKLRTKCENVISV